MLDIPIALLISTGQTDSEKVYLDEQTLWFCQLLLISVVDLGISFLKNRERFTYFQGIDSVSVFIQCIHEMHGKDRNMEKSRVTLLCHMVLYISTLLDSTG